MTRIAILTAAALLSTASIASADYRSHHHGYGSSYGTNEIDRRQESQERRIQQGARSGELTRHEYQHLEAEQARIRQLERNAKADGYLSASERAQIRNAQNNAGRHIYRERHDNEHRSSGHHHHYRPWWRWY